MANQIRHTIWKFVLDGTTGPFDVKIPAPGHIQHVGIDPESRGIAFWAQVDPEAPARLRRFQIFGTGWAIPSDANPVGTAIDGDFVWHLFELRGEG